MTVYLVTLIDRHIDDVVTVHVDDESAAIRVNALMDVYGAQHYDWTWNERCKTWETFDDGPSIRVERKDVQ